MIIRLFDMVVQYGPWTGVALAGSVAVFVIVVGAQAPKVLVIASLGCYSALTLNPSLFSVPGVVDLRVVALGIAVYLALVRGRPPKFSTLRHGAFPAALVFYGLGFVTIGTSQDMGVSSDSLFAGLLCVAFVWLIVSAADADEIRSSLHIVTGAVLLASFVYVFVDPSGAKVHGRWAGAVSNANTLGVYAALFFLSARPARALTSLPATIIGLIGSASRSSAFAVGLVVGPRMTSGFSPRLRRLAAIAGVIAALPVIHAVFFSQGDATGSSTGNHGGSLTRTANSRGDFWVEGWRIFVDNIATGVGLGNEPRLLSSSVISPIVQVGILGFVPLFMITALALRRPRGNSTVFRGMFVFFLIHGVFEMWLFAGGSVIFVGFLIAAYDPELAADRASRADDVEDVEDSREVGGDAGDLDEVLVPSTRAGGFAARGRRS